MLLAQTGIWAGKEPPKDEMAKNIDVKLDEDEDPESDRGKRKLEEAKEQYIAKMEADRRNKMDNYALECVKELLKKNAKVNIADHHGKQTIRQQIKIEFHSTIHFSEFTCFVELLNEIPLKSQ